MNNIKNMREKKGISRAELHRRTGIKIRTLEEWEADKLVPSVYHRLKKIAEVLECTVDDLMVRKEPAVWDNEDVCIHLELIEDGTSLKIYYANGKLMLAEVIPNECGAALIKHLKKDRDISDFMYNQISFVK